MTAILEINDFELTLYRGSERVYRAPAVAIVSESEIVFGEQALRQARLFPQQANLQYLARLNADPLSHPVSRAANHADLIYLHFQELKSLFSDELVLAVPGTLSGEQLGVLLGICHEVGFQINGFVDSAVAAVSTAKVPAQVFYLDVHLQHTVVTQLTIDGQVRKDRAEEVRECGATGLVDGWVNLIADRFVQETRFDPLHTADTEQQLYNQVYNWLDGAHHASEVGIEVAHADQRRRVEMSKPQLEQKARQRFERVIESLPAGAAVVLSARTARVPGFSQALKNSGRNVEILAASAVAQGCENNLDVIVGDSDNLRLINRLPHTHDVQQGSDPQPQQATHLLTGHVARPIAGDTVFATRPQNGGLWLIANPRLRLNGEPVRDDVRLREGDQLDDGTSSATAIRVEGT